jgi:hypothetical protein
MAQDPSRVSYKLVTSLIATPEGRTTGDQHGRFPLAGDGVRAMATVTPSGSDRQVIGRERMRMRASSTTTTDPASSASRTAGRFK